MNPINVGCAIFSFGVGIWCIKQDEFLIASFNFAAAGINGAIAVM